MEIKTQGYADWIHYVTVGYHPPKRKLRDRFYMWKIRTFRRNLANG